MNRAFTIAVCTSCSPVSVISALAQLRSLIDRCPQGVLVRTNCLLGAVTCASRPTGAGAMVVFQPCSIDRRPTGPAFWFGPIDDVVDVRLVCDFVERGVWEAEEVGNVPNRLFAHHNWVTQLNRTN
jgi:hypothetical protein